MKKRHHKDGNHGKRGWVAGNPRYNRARLNNTLKGKRGPHKDKSMGKN